MEIHFLLHIMIRMYVDYFMGRALLAEGLLEQRVDRVFVVDRETTGKVGTPTMMMNDVQIYCSVATHGH